MARMNRLRWIPMLIQAYREAQYRTRINSDLTTITTPAIQHTSPENPITSGTSNSTGKANDRKTNHRKPQPVKQTGTLVKCDSKAAIRTKQKQRDTKGTAQKLVQEVRSEYRKSWGRLDNISEKIANVDAKIEGLKEELRELRQQQSTESVTSRLEPPVGPHGAPFPRDPYYGAR